jgi:hypothetical protein
MELDYFGLRDDWRWTSRVPRNAADWLQWSWKLAAEEISDC